MVKRKISMDKFILAGAITLVIFAFGVILGFVLDDWRVDSIERINKEQEVNYMSIQLQHLFLSSLKDDNASCLVLHTALDNSVRALSRSLDEYQAYKKETTLNEDEYLIIGRRYLIDNIRYWFLSRESKASCDIDLVIILYFYQADNCDDCPEQGTILTYFKKLYGEEVLVFPIDVGLESSEGLITILKARYNITTYPSIVAYDEKYEGLLSKDELGEIICDSFSEEALCKT